MMIRSILNILFGLLVFWRESPVQAQLAAIKKPKLILVLVIDQFRADQIARFENRFLPATRGRDELGGFRYLMEQGAYFPQAEYGLLQNMTGPGHATILSGAHAYQHGITLNEWLDRDSGKRVYCVEDSGSPLVGVEQTSKRQGASPLFMQGSTLGDELKNSGYDSRVVGIAMKDRSAILLGGHRSDLALWFDATAGRWISSQYYLQDRKLPPWVTALNQKIDAKKTPFIDWVLTDKEAASTSLKNNELATSKKTLEALQAGFPHRVRTDTKYALMTPYGTQLTGDAAIAAMDSLQLGKRDATDILAISFSSHDFLGHSFGPNSRELEELTIVEDQEIARLLTHAQKTVGLDQTIVILTADHGAPPQPEWLKAQKVPAGRIDESAILKAGEAFLQKTYGPLKNESWILDTIELNLYLNDKAIQKGKLDRDQLIAQLVSFYRQNLSSFEGVDQVFSSIDVRSNALPGILTAQQIKKGYHAQRSGDLVFLPKPFYISDDDTTNHMSGYTYDRTVPLFLLGPQIKPGVYGQKADITDIAPTLAFFTGTTPPSGSEGRVLFEIFKNGDGARGQK
jgi:predicted AlkP superfamily pyrophosphatase or phosphodiesterase